MSGAGLQALCSLVPSAPAAGQTSPRRPYVKGRLCCLQGWAYQGVLAAWPAEPVDENGAAFQQIHLAVAVQPPGLVHLAGALLGVTLACRPPGSTCCAQHPQHKKYFLGLYSGNRLQEPWGSMGLPLPVKNRKGTAPPVCQKVHPGPRMDTRSHTQCYHMPALPTWAHTAL